ncbi:MAG: leucine-rich repeat domain-containing protein [Clostridium sp.]|jgi:hypothetical protein|nr:leucine-rich repeat domain-containing protein [Clostridium sp.]
MKKYKKLILLPGLLAALFLARAALPETAAASASDFQLNGSTLVKYDGGAETVAVPASVRTVGQSAFEGRNLLRKVILPDSVTTIESYAFWGCQNLETVQLGKGLTEIGDYAFANATGLKNVEIPANVQSIGISAFAGCASLTDLTIPASVTFIHATAFDGCGQLTIHAEDGSYAAQYAEELAKRQAQAGNGRAADLAGSAEGAGNGETAAADLAGSIEGAGSGNGETAAAGLAGSIEAADANPSSEIGAAAGNPSADGGGNVLGDTHVVGNQAVLLWDHTGLSVRNAEVSDPSRQAQGSPADAGAQEADTGDVQGADGGNLPKYRLVEHRILADGAYYGDTEKTISNLPIGIEEIGRFSFARSALRQITLPSGVQTIGYGAFYHCDDLETVNLPESVRSVEPKAFANTLWVKRFLESADSDFLISGGVLVAYRGRESDVVLPEGIRVIAAEVFAGHEEITSVTLPDSLRVVGEGAFWDCGNLRRILGGTQLEQVKDRAFGGCPVDTIRLADTVEQIGLGAFAASGEAAPGASVRTAVFQSARLPKISYETTAQRLSNADFRQAPLQGVLFAVVEPQVTGEELADTVLGGAITPFQGLIGSIGEDGKLHCRYTNLTPEELSGLSVPETVLVDGRNYEVADVGLIQSLEIQKSRPEPGSIVATGAVDGVSAFLDGATDGEETAAWDGAASGYELRLDVPADTGRLAAAYERSFHKALPGDTVVYDVTLLDGKSGVPIAALGKQSLTVTMPVPEGLSGRELKVFTLDRNGQLETVAATVEQTGEGGKVTFRLRSVTWCAFCPAE